VAAAAAAYIISRASNRRPFSSSRRRSDFGRALHGVSSRSAPGRRVFCALSREFRRRDRIISNHVLLPPLLLCRPFEFARKTWVLACFFLLPNKHARMRFFFSFSDWNRTIDYTRTDVTRTWYYMLLLLLGYCRVCVCARARWTVPGRFVPHDAPHTRSRNWWNVFFFFPRSNRYHRWPVQNLLFKFQIWFPSSAFTLHYTFVDTRTNPLLLNTRDVFFFSLLCLWRNGGFRYLSASKVAYTSRDIRNLLDDARDYILIFLIVSVRKRRTKPVSRYTQGFTLL